MKTALFTVEWLAVVRWLAIAIFFYHAVRRRSLTTWVIVAMVAGVELGHDAPSFSVNMELFGTIFLRLIKTAIAPLLFSVLVVGIGGHADLRRIGRLGAKAILYFEVVSTLAMLLGFAAIAISRAGIGVNAHLSSTGSGVDGGSHSVVDLIANIFPENIAKAIAEGQILQVVVFSLLFGVALAKAPEPVRSPLIVFTTSLSEVMFKFTNIVMRLAPLGVFGAIASTVGRTGVAVLVPLLRVVATMYIALSVFVIVVLVPIAVVAGVPLVAFFKAALKPVAIAFATASSEAALPRAMEEMQEMGVSRGVVGFVLPLGYTFNLDGSSLYQSIAVTFVAQAAGVHFSRSQQVLLLLTLLVSSKGTAGVARASLVVVMGVAAGFHLPSGPILILLSIDQVMDMARTAVNVLGNCLATLVIARWEGESAPFSG